MSEARDAGGVRASGQLAKFDLHRHPDPDIADRILRHINVHSQFYDTGQAHYRGSGAARIGRPFHGRGRAVLAAGSDQRSGIDEALGHDSVEGRDDLRVRDHRGKFVGLGLRLLELAIGHVDVLACHEPRVAFPDLIQPFIGQALNLQIGACAIQALTQLGNLDVRQHLALFHPVALVDKDVLQIASDLGV